MSIPTGYLVNPYILLPVPHVHEHQMNNRRTERGAFFPPFWKTDSHYVVVEFSKQLNLSEPEEIFIAAEGKYNVKLDGKLLFGMPETMLLPAGKHNLNIKVWNQAISYISFSFFFLLLTN